MSPTIITSLFGSILRVGRPSTPPMGTPNGIAELKPVDLNGYPQWLLIRGQDVSKPLLLFLHGGPGESNMWTTHCAHRTAALAIRSAESPAARTFLGKRPGDESRGSAP